MQRLNCCFTDCIPDPSSLDSDPEMPKTVIKLRKTLQEAAAQTDKRPPPNYDLVQSKVTLQSLGINLGDHVVVGGVKVSNIIFIQNRTKLHNEINSLRPWAEGIMR